MGSATRPASQQARSAAKAAATTGPRKPRHRSRPPENSLPGDADWWISNLGAPDEIGGYAGQASVLPGEPIDLYVSTTSREFEVKAFRMGWYGGDLARKVWKSGTIRGHRQRPSGFEDSTRTVHTSWGVSLTVPTDGWPAGRVPVPAGRALRRAAVRSGDGAVGQHCRQGRAEERGADVAGLQHLGRVRPVPGPGSGYDNRSYAVSMDRPIDMDGAYLFMVYERKLINLAERLGLPLAYLTSMDIASDPHALDGAARWSRPATTSTGRRRSAPTSPRPGTPGMNLAFLGANAMFRRTRLEPTPLGADRLVVCYKTSYQQDPMYGKDNALVTSDWREPPDPDPESSVIGTLYEGYPAVADYVVATPDAWMFGGTGARKGTRFPALVGIEYDRVNPGYPVRAADPGTRPTRR